MKDRKLRIAWSVACGVLCLLLIVLWVRRYVADSYKVVRNPSPAQSGYMVSSIRGKLTISTLKLLSFPGGGVGVHYVPPSQMANTVRFLGFEWNRSAFAVSVPYWSPVVLCAALAVSPWLRWRFRLRTLLIGMTVVAALLGLAIALRGS
jgi:hypothetical protein